MKFINRTFNLILSLVLFILSLNFFACDNFYAYDFSCFNSDVYVVVNGKLKDKVVDKITDLLAEIEDSVVLTDFNEATANSEVLLSNHALNLFEEASSCYNLTRGLFNVAILPLLDLWELSSEKFNPKKEIFSPPTNEQILSVLPACDFNKIIIDKSNRTAKKLSDGIKVHFGASAKGYAVDLIKDILIEEGFSSGYINIGGSSLFVLDFSDGLSIRHPENPYNSIIKVNSNIIKNSPLSTSGDYMKYYIDENGNRYSHIINGKTGYPTNTGFHSVTVIANDKSSACFADMISTSLMLMEKQEFISFANENLLNYTIFAVYKNQILTNAKASDFALLDANYSIVNI